MNKLNYLLLSAAAVAALPACQPTEEIPPPEHATAPVIQQASVIGQGYEFAGNGKVHDTEGQEELYELAALEDFSADLLNEELVSGLKRQLRVIKYFKKRNKEQFGELKVTYHELEATIQLLLNQYEAGHHTLPSNIAAHRIKGEDGLGNVHFTGYFTPVLKVSRQKDDVYKYPLYTRPKKWKGKLPTRAQIDGEGALAEMGLELAYAKNLVDIYFMQVQGSGIVEFEDGSSQLFAHDGSNSHPYSSIGHYMVEQGYTTPDRVSLKSIRKFFERQPELLEKILFINKSYIFFTPSNSGPKGAGLAELSPNYSIAVDTRYIPMGSCLLAKVPIINKRNQVIRHEYRLLMAQDIGGAIKGPGHVDLYTGVGYKGQRMASALHHYGSLWLLLPEQKQQLAVR
ncbi:MAG: murein transglycosylase A [Bacteroidota bacterium]